MGGTTDLERGYGDVWPWRPPVKTPFSCSLVVRKGPISSKRVSSQDLLLNFWPNFSYQAPKFRNFQLTSPLFTSPQMEIFSSHAPSFRDKYQFASPTLRNPGHILLPEKKKKKSWVSPSPAGLLSFDHGLYERSYSIVYKYWLLMREMVKTISPRCSGDRYYFPAGRRPKGK